MTEQDEVLKRRAQEGSRFDNDIFRSYLDIDCSVVLGLIARLEAAEEAAERYEKRHVCSESTLAALMPRWEAAENDAARYRLLRLSDPLIVVGPNGSLAGDSLDAAIEAELAKGRG